MSKLISPKMKTLLMVLAVIYVGFTAVFLYYYLQYNDRRSVEDIAGMVAGGVELVLNEHVVTHEGRVLVRTVTPEGDNGAPLTLYEPLEPGAEVPEGAEVIEVEAAELDAHVLINQETAPGVLPRLALADSPEPSTGFLVRGEGAPIGPNATAIYQILNFLVLLLALIAVGWKPLIEALDQRAEKIQSDITAAETDRQEAATLKSQYDGMLDRGRRERSELIAKGEEVAKRERERMLAKTDEETKRLLANAEQEVTAKETQLRQQLSGELLTLTRDLSGRLLKREVTPEDHKEMVDEFVQKLQQGPNA
jgi:F-type H+-transporting ATPase subunit b